MEKMVKWMSYLIHQSYQRTFFSFWIMLCLGLVFPLAGFSRESGNERNMGYLSLARLANMKRIQKEKIVSQLVDKNPWCARCTSYCVDNDMAPWKPSPEIATERTDSTLVSSIMALLATFEGANILPPEGSSQANQLIHGLIQLQSALVKSHTSELNEYVSAAMAYSFERESKELVQSIQRNGLSSKVLEAVLIYDKKIPIWEQVAIARTLQGYNVSRSDWQLIGHVFSRADAAYRARGSSLHKIYDQWRSQIRGDG
jgi:hypothetical protein